MSRESGYYPPGAEFDPRAPYNDIGPKELTYHVEIQLEMEDGTTHTVEKDVDIDWYGETDSDFECLLLDAADLGNDWVDYELIDYYQL